MPAHRWMVPSRRHARRDHSNACYLLFSEPPVERPSQADGEDLAVSNSATSFFATPASDFGKHRRNSTPFRSDGRRPLPMREPPSAAEAEPEPAVSHCPHGKQERFDTLLDTFLGPRPDVRGTDELLAILGNQATIDPESIEYLDLSDQYVGDIEIPGTDLRGRFTTGGGERTRVELSDGRSVEFFEKRNLFLSFDSSTGRPTNVSVTAQHHPNHERIIRDLEVGEEHIAGWSISNTGAEARLRPIVYSRQERGRFQIGHSQELPVETTAPLNSSGYVAWMLAIERAIASRSDMLR